METVGRKISNKNNSVYRSYQAQTNGMDALDSFYPDQSFVDWYKTTKDILNIFSKRMGFWT